MVNLLPNTAGQTMYCTPFEARKFLASFTDYLVVLRNDASEETFPFIANVIYDNERYSQFRVSTATDNPTGSSILLTESGLYTYTIYGQNSTTNLDPEDASIVGVCEVGACRITATDTYFDFDNPTVPDNVIYYE